MLCHRAIHEQMGGCIRGDTGVGLMLTGCPAPSIPHQEVGGVVHERSLLSPLSSQLGGAQKP